MKKVRFISIILLISMLYIPTFAQTAINAKFELGAETIKITGTISEGYPYSNVMISFFKPDKNLTTLPEITEAELQKNLFFMDQVNSDANGKFEFIVNISEVTGGNCLVRITADDMTMPYEETIFFATEKQKETLIENVNNATSATEIKTTLNLTDASSLNAKILGISEPMVFDVSDVIYDVFFNMNKENKVDPKDPAKFVSLLTKCAYVAALNDGKTFDILTCQEMLGLNSNYVETYNKKLSNKIKENFTLNFKDCRLTTLEDANEKFEEVVFLSAINNLQNWSDINYMIEKHGSDMGIDMQKYNSLSKKDVIVDDIAKKLPFKSTADFSIATSDSIIKNSTSPVPTPTPGGSGGGGGGGGGSTGGSINVSGDTTLPVIPTDDFTNNKEELKFTDINGVPWAKESITYLFNNGIISGVSNDKFEPERKISREEFIKILVLAFDIPLIHEGETFSDVKNEDWFYPYINAAKTVDIIKGREDGTFGVNEFITREEMASLAYRAAKSKGIAFKNDAEFKFEDDKEIASYAKEAIYSMKSEKIINGISDNFFAPKENCTRAEACKIIFGLMKLEK